MTINREVARIASRPNKIRRKHVYPLIMNGDMRIAQRGTSATGLGTAITIPTIVQSGLSNSIRFDRDNSFDLFDSFSGVQFGHVNGIGLEGATGVSTSIAKYAYVYGASDSDTRVLMLAEL